MIKKSLIRDFLSACEVCDPEFPPLNQLEITGGRFAVIEVKDGVSPTVLVRVAQAFRDVAGADADKTVVVGNRLILDLAPETLPKMQIQIGRHLLIDETIFQKFVMYMRAADPRWVPLTPGRFSGAFNMQAPQGYNLACLLNNAYSPLEHFRQENTRMAYNAMLRNMLEVLDCERGELKIGVRREGNVGKPYLAATSRALERMRDLLYPEYAEAPVLSPENAGEAVQR